MKKLMIFSMILMPIIVLMILLISSNVVAVTSHVYVEALEMESSGPIILNMSDEDNKPTQQLNVRVLPVAAKNSKLSYGSADTSIVTVSESGLISAVDFGETYVTVKSQENSSVSLTRKVVVTDTKIHRLAIKNAPSDLYVGQTMQLEVKVTPEEAINKQLVFMSSNQGVVSVASDGTIIAEGFGTATITVRSQEVETAVDSFEINIHSPLDGLSIASPETLTIAERTASFPDVSFIPATANEQISYRSSNEQIASVSAEGEIRFMSAGEVTITAWATDGLGNIRSVSKTYVCTDGYYTDIAFEQSEYEFDFDDLQGVALRIVGSPDGASRGLSAPEFSQNGVLQYRGGKYYAIGTSLGGVTITVRGRTWDDRPLVARCIVRVLRDATAVSLAKDAAITTTNSYDLSGAVTITPENSTNALKFSSASEGVEISESGLVTFTDGAEGTFLIKAYTVDKEGTETASAYFSLTHTEIKRNEKKTLAVVAGARDLRLTIKFAEPNAALLFTTSGKHHNVSHAVTRGQDVLSVDDFGHITAIKGGEALITITASDDDGDEIKTEVLVYVDRDIERIELSRDNGDELVTGYRTSKTQISATAKVYPADAFVGKTLNFGAGVTAVKAADEGGASVFSLEIDFGVSRSISVDPRVTLDGETRFSAALTLYSTQNTIDQFTLLSGESEVRNGQRLYIYNIGDPSKDSLTLTIPYNFTPSDFELAPEQISVSANVAYEVTKSLDGGSFKLVFKGLAASKAGQAVSIELGGVTHNFTLVIHKNVTELRFVEPVISVTAAIYDAIDEHNLVISAGHTNTIEYTSSSDEVASVENGVVSMHKQNEQATITVEAKDYLGETVMSATLTISYTKVAPGAREIHVDGASNEQENVYLEFGQKASIIVTPKEGYANATLTPSGEAISLNGSDITTVCGGFAQVVVSMESEAGGDPWTKTILFYVDQELDQKTFSVASGLRTSLSSLSLTLTISPASALEGKEVSFSDGVSASAGRKEQGNMVFNLTLTFKEENRGEPTTLRASVKYGARVQELFESECKDDSVIDFASVRITSTMGEIDNLAVKNGANTVTQDEKFTIHNVGESIELVIENNITPEDFELTAEKVNVSAGESLEVTKRLGEGGKVIITLIGRSPKTGERVSIALGGKILEFSVDVHKNATSVEITKGSKAVTKQYTLGSADYTVLERDHTNTLRFESSNDEIATVEGGVVTFLEEGVVEITISALSDTNSVTASGKITLSWVDAKSDEGVATTVDFASQAKTTIEIDLAADGTEKRALGIIPTAGHINVSFEVAGSSIRVDGFGHITTLMGGKSTITIKAQTISGEAEERIVEVIVDRAIDRVEILREDSIELSGLLTSKDSVRFLVKVYPQDAALTKTLSFVQSDISAGEGSAQGGAMVYACTAKLSNGDNRITARLSYNGAMKKEATAQVSSTMGKLNSFEVKHGEDAVSENQKFTLRNNTAENALTLAVGSGLIPTDFVIGSAEDVEVRISGNALTSAVRAANGHYEIVLTPNPKTATYGVDANVTITIGEKDFAVKVEVLALADKIDVKVGAKTLLAGTTYYSVDSALTFSVTVSRQDGLTVSNVGAKYTSGALSGQNAAEISQFTITISGEDITFTSLDGNAQITIKIRKIALADLGVKITYAGSSAPLGEFERLEGEHKYNVGKLFQGTFTISFINTQGLEILSPSVEEFQRLVSVEGLDGWGIEYVASTLSIVIKAGSEAEFKKNIHVSTGAASAAFELVKLDVGAMEFVGYDMDKNVSAGSVNEDIYRGYQQVRVFAKHSFYGKVVDYFKIDFKYVKSDLISMANTDFIQYIKWTMTGFRGKDSTGVISTQVGRKITFNGTTFTLNEDGSLTRDGDNKLIVSAEGVYQDSAIMPTFVDPFTEVGKIRIYSGAFDGLNEEDIQNDNFGAFDILDSSKQSSVKAGTTGTFLRLTAVYDELVEEFNFNVVNDVNGNRLINIVDGAGFLDSTHGKYVVIQADIAPQSTDKGLLGTELIYGNGYTIDYSYVSINGDNGSSGARSLRFGKAYNANLKGAEQDDTAHHLLEFKATWVQYCDIMSVKKGTWTTDGNDIHIKNTVYRHCDEAAVQIYKNASTPANNIYVENIIIIDSLAGLEFVGEEEYAHETTDKKYYIKGFLDVFNFRNKADLEPFVADLQEWGLTDAAVGLLINSAKKSGIVVEFNKTDFFNLVMFNSKKGGYVRGFAYWNGSDYSHIKNHEETHIFDIKTWELDDKNISYNDGTTSYKITHVEDSTMSLAGIGVWGFPDRADIKAECQLMVDGSGATVPNSDHLAWHMQRVRRNTSILGWDFSKHVAGQNKL